MTERRPKEIIDTENPRRYEIVNTKINKHKNFVDIIYFKENFGVYYGTPDYELIDLETGEKLKRQRNWIMEDNKLKPLKDGLTLNDRERAIFNSCKRAKDNFYGYGLNNTWKYFVTLTVSISEYDSSDEAIKNFWKLLCQKLKRDLGMKDIKILCVPERHKKNNNIHFHALMGECNLDSYLTIAINPHTNEPIKNKGRQVYNFNLWNKGYSTVVKIDTDKESQSKTVSYLIKYVTKHDNIGYNSKKYYRTNNLAFKEVKLIHNTEKDLQALTRNAEHIKENQRMAVYRINKSKEHTKPKTDNADWVRELNKELKTQSIYQSTLAVNNEKL